MAKQTYQRLANQFTIAASSVALLAFLFGVYQFRETQIISRENLILQRDAFEQENESKAVDLYIKYNEVMAAPDSNKNSKFWKDNLGVSIAESIYKLKADDKGWTQTVALMVGNHQEFLIKEGIDCTTYNREFIEFTEKVIQRNICH